MTPTPEPDTRQSLKGAWIVVIVAAILAIGLHLFNLVRKPEPWPSAAPGLLTPAGLIFLAWSGLLPTASSGTRRTLLGLACVCIVIGLVLAALQLFRL